MSARPATAVAWQTPPTAVGEGGGVRPTVEAATPGAPVRRPGAAGDGLPLSHRLLEVEPRGASPVWSDQRQLGGSARAHLGNPAGPHPRRHHDDSLDVQAAPLDGVYPTGQRVSDAAMDTLNLAP